MSDVHEHVRSLIAAYSLGAIPDEEIPPIRAHILTCEECFADAEMFADDAALLTVAIEPVPLPAGFEQRVLAQIQEERPATVPVQRRSWWRGRVATFAAAAAVLAAVFVASFSYLSVRATQQRYEDVIVSLVHDRDSFNLTGPGGAEAVIASTGDGSVIAAVDLGEAPNDREYQLWLMKDGEPVPADTFNVDEPIVVIESDHSLDGYDGAAVTVEPVGGSEEPTTEPVLSTS
jgi:anti-sigma-K factor RskA